MIYVTNGWAQDLPQTTQFQFWDNQLDWGRAFKIAKIRQNDVLGPSVAPRHEVMVHVLLEVIASDPYKSFTSRPAGREPDWCRWAAFCYWFYRQNMDQSWNTLEQIRTGQIAVWFPAFNAWAADFGSLQNYCCGSNRAVDDTVFWDYHEFDKSKCSSTRKVPETFPTPEEIAEMVRGGQWLAEMLGSDTTAQNFYDSPPTLEQRAASFDASPPPPAPVDETIYESKGISIPLVIGGVILTAWLIFKR